MTVKKLIEKLRYLPLDADVVIVLPKEAVPQEDNPFKAVAYPINKIFISRDNNNTFYEIGISV